MIFNIVNDTLKDLRYIGFYKSIIFSSISFKLIYSSFLKYKVIFNLYFAPIIPNIAKDRIDKLSTNEINQFNLIYAYLKDAIFYNI